MKDTTERKNIICYYAYIEYVYTRVASLLKSVRVFASQKGKLLCYHREADYDPSSSRCTEDGVVRPSLTKWLIHVE